MINEISIIGYGTMGKGIAQLIAFKGYKINIIGYDFKKLKKALIDIDENLNLLVEKKKISPNEKNRTINNLHPYLGKENCKKSQLIIEAIPEDLKLKKKTFRELDSINKEGIIASNTSSLSINEIANACKNKKRIIGMHFFNPVYMLPLVEIIKTKYTSNETIKEALVFLDKIDKKPIVVKDSPGFIVNRLLIPMINESIWLLNNKIAVKEDIDKAMKLGANHPMGPLELADYIGLDIVLDIMKSLNKNIGGKYKPCPLLREMVKKNKLGRKTKEGFYKY